MKSRLMREEGFDEKIDLEEGQVSRAQFEGGGMLRFYATVRDRSIGKGRKKAKV